MTTVVLVAALVGQSPAGATETPVVGTPHAIWSQSMLGWDAAFDGTNTLVVWTDQLSHHVYGERVAPNGSVLAPGSFLISTESGAQSLRKVIWDGHHFVVLWVSHTSTTADHMRLARVTTGGAMLDAPSVDLGEGHDPSIAANHASDRVVWTDTDVVSARVSFDGAVIDSTPQVLVVAQEFEPLAAGELVSNGTDFLLGYVSFFDDGSDTHLMSVAADGTPGPTTDAPSGDFSWASDGTSYLLAWSRCVDPSGDCEFGGDHDIYAQKYAQDLSNPTAPVLMATTDVDQINPSVAYNAGRYMVAYRRQALRADGGGGATGVGPIDIRASNLAADGTTKLNGGYIVAQGVRGGHLTRPGPGDDFSELYTTRPGAAPDTLNFVSVSPK